MRVVSACQQALLPPCLNTWARTNPSRCDVSYLSVYFFHLPQIEYVLAYSDLTNLEFVRIVSEVWSPCTFTASPTEGLVEPMRAMSKITGEWSWKYSRGQIAWESSLKQVPWRVLAAWLQWLYVFASDENSISFHIAYNSNFWLISAGLASTLIKAKWGLTLLISNLIHLQQKFKWLCFSKRTRDEEGRGKSVCFIHIDTCSTRELGQVPKSLRAPNSSQGEWKQV